MGVLAIFMYMLTGVGLSTDKHEFYRTTQMAEEWARKPIVDIVIQDTECEADKGMRELFTRTWEGTVPACDISTDILTREEYDALPQERD